MILFSEKAPPESGRIRWYALQVWSRKENYVSLHLQGLGYECFLPTYRCQRKWSDRIKEFEPPLFPGYLFCRFEFEARRSLVMSPGVLQVVGNGKTAIPVPDSEILKLQMAVASEAPRQPWPYIALGQRVRVTYGSLSGLEGILINFKGSHRVVLSVTLLQRSVAIEVEQSWIAALEPSRNPSTTKDFAERSTRIPANSY